MPRSASKSDTGKAVSEKIEIGASEIMLHISIAERAVGKFTFPKRFCFSYPIWKAVL